MSQKVKGYKATEKDMTCRGMQYEMGVTYRAEGRVELCKNGFHFCRKLRNVFDYYERDSRVFEVIAKEEDTDGKKSVASKITLIREVPSIVINRSLYGDGYTDGDGYGFGCGYGDGHGFGPQDLGFGGGNGDGWGSGNGDYHGNGYGDGYGYNNDGCGGGNGDGLCDGCGGGNGDGWGGGKKNIQKILKLEEC